MDSRDELPPGQTPSAALKVQHYGPVPRERAQWRLTFFGARPDPGAGPVGGPRASEVSDAGLDAADLGRLAQVAVQADLHCASGWTAQGLRWEGVAAATLLERYPPPAGTVGVLVVAQYGYSANVRLEDLIRPTTLLATRLDGHPLAPQHGGPVRLVVPHLYGYKSVKWLRGWEYLQSPRRGFWEERGYHLVGDAWTGRRYSYQE